MTGYKRKDPLRLLTIPEFLAEHPKITDHQVRFALRNREANGFEPCVWFQQHGRRRVVLDVERTVAYFTAVVRA
jgi:hypothetical protein